MRWFSFAEVVTDATSKFRKIKASDYQSEGQYKIIDQGKDAIAGYTNDKTLISSDLLPIIIFGDHTRVLKYEDTPIALGADGAKALKVDSRFANTLYVYYYLRTIKLKDAGYSRHFKFLKEIAIPIPLKDGVPNLDDQIRIAHLLGKVEGLIAQRKQHLQQLNDLLKSVFLEMFGDPVRHEMGWERPPLEKLGSLNRGVSKHRPRNAPELLGGKYPLIQTGEVSNAGTYITSFSHTYSDIGFAQSKLWPSGTLCITIAANIAQTAILTYEACFPDSVVGFTAFEKEAHPLYVHGLFLFFQKILEKNAPAAAQKNINLEILRGLEVPKPPIGLQQQFATIVEKVESIKSRYQYSITQLDALYGTLSQQAFKGELDLSRVPLKAAGTTEGMESAEEINHKIHEQHKPEQA
ncbi:restriction endonuclease subunit S [Acidithiobacillus sp.]